MIEKKSTNHTKNHQYNVTWKNSNNKHILQTSTKYTHMKEKRNED